MVKSKAAKKVRAKAELSDLMSRVKRVAKNAARARARKRKKDEESRKNRSSAHYENCLVTFIDILGFREILRTKTADEVKSILEMLHKFNSTEDKEPPRTSGGKRAYSYTYSQSVSDAIVRVRPYQTEYNDGALFYELLDLVHAQANLLQQGVFIRAGMSIGHVYVGVRPGEIIFGPAMARAYELESKVAVFPRIVVDDDVIKQHAKNEELRARQNTELYERRVIDQFLASDKRGVRFLDYLRKVASQFDEPSDFFVFLQRHAALIRKGLASSKDKRTKKKYRWLARYHNAVVSEYRLRVLASAESQRVFHDEVGEVPRRYFATVRIR